MNIITAAAAAVCLLSPDKVTAGISGLCPPRKQKIIYFWGWSMQTVDYPHW